MDEGIELDIDDEGSRSSFLNLFLP